MKEPQAQHCSKYHIFLTGFFELLGNFSHNWLPSVNGTQFVFSKARIDMLAGLPRTGPRFWHGSGPCCPATSSGARGCWRRTWPGCTGGPPASRGRSHAPSSGPWPSELCGSFWSGPSRPRRRWCAATRVEGDTGLSAAFCPCAYVSDDEAEFWG